MTFEYHKNLLSGERHIHIVLTDQDVHDAYTNMDRMDRNCLSQWGREDSSVEEKLMALQLYARKLEKVAA